jgi:hypothetical protein
MLPADEDHAGVNLTRDPFARDLRKWLGTEAQRRFISNRAAPAHLFLGWRRERICPVCLRA